MPTHLQTGKRYWYRLRLIHEGGKSVGGPWVSHLTCVVPPRCVEVGSRSLVLALPRAIDEVVSPKLIKDGEMARASGGRRCSRNHTGDEQQPTEQTSATAGDNTEDLAANELIRKEGSEKTVHMDGKGDEASEARHGDSGGWREQDSCEEEPETPMLWYTLEGLTRMSGWSVLYRGSSPEVIVEARESKVQGRVFVGWQLALHRFGLRVCFLRSEAYLHLLGQYLTFTG